MEIVDECSTKDAARQAQRLGDRRVPSEQELLDDGVLVGYLFMYTYTCIQGVSEKENRLENVKISLDPIRLRFGSKPGFQIVAESDRNVLLGGVTEVTEHRRFYGQTVIDRANSGLIAIIVLSRCIIDKPCSRAKK